MRRQIRDLLPLDQLPAHARVLDLGCGSGTVSYARFPRLRFFGVDQYAHTDCGEWPPNAWLALADGERLPWSAGCFDAAVCNFVFEHLRDPRSALRELERVMATGGFLYISIPRFTSLEDRLYRFTTKGGGHAQKYTLDRFLHLVYEETAFKLEGWAPLPGAFTWLNDMPCGGLVRNLLFHGARAWHRATGNNPMAASGYLLLFRMGELRGLKRIFQVCSRCGNTHTAPPPTLNASWICPVCAFQNVLVSR